MTEWNKYNGIDSESKHGILGSNFFLMVDPYIKN